MNEMIKAESRIGTKGAAEYLGVKPATIRDWIRKGKDIPREKSETPGKSSAPNWRNGLPAGRVQ